MMWIPELTSLITQWDPQSEDRFQPLSAYTMTTIYILFLFKEISYSKFGCIASTIFKVFRLSRIHICSKFITDFSIGLHAIFVPISQLIHIQDAYTECCTNCNRQWQMLEGPVLILSFFYLSDPLCNCWSYYVTHSCFSNSLYNLHNCIIIFRIE